MISKESYLNFIDKLTEKYSKRFGDNAWWYSLISEKNPSKSMVYHNLVKGNIPGDKYVAVKSILSGAKKWISFLVRQLIFYNFKRSHNFKDSANTIFITYDKDFLYPFTEKNRDGLHIYLPQKNKWREHKSEVVIDNYVSFAV